MEFISTFTGKGEKRGIILLFKVFDAVGVDLEFPFPVQLDISDPVVMLH
jgi:hypothetical protein